MSAKVTNSRYLKVSDFAEVYSGGTPSTGDTEYWDGDVAWVTPKDLSTLTSVYIGHGSRSITEEGLRRSSAYLLPADTVILSSRAPVGYVAIAKSPLATNQGCKNLRCKEGVAHPLYVYYLLKNSTAVLESHATGSTYTELSASRLKNIAFPMPKSVSDQISISSILSAYDDLIENNHRRIGLLERAARLLYKEWFVRLRFPGHELVSISNGIPDGWTRSTAFDVMDILSGGTPDTMNPLYWNGAIPFFTPKDATAGAYVFSTEKHLSEEGLRNCNSRLYPKDTVFISARGTVGKIAMAQTDMAMSQSSYALVATEPLNQLFLYLQLLDAVELLRSRAVGSVFAAIIRNTFRSIPFIVPERRVIHLFTNLVSPMFRQIDILSHEIRMLTQARDLLLPRLMSGRIAV